MKNSFTAKILLYFIILSCVTMNFRPAHADTVLLKNGDRLSGHVIDRYNQAVLVFRTSFGSEIRIPWPSILSIQNQQAMGSVETFSNFAPITLKKPSVKTAQTTAATEQQIKPPETHNQTPPPSQPIIHMKEDVHKDPKSYKWTGRMNVSGQVESGNDDSQAFTFDGEVNARNDIYKFQLSGDFDWEQEEGRITENEKELDIEIDRFVSKQWFIGSRASFKSDKLEDLDLRTKLGLLTGYQFYEQDDINLLVRAGFDYINENFKQTSTDTNIAGTWGMNYDQKFWDDFLTIFHEHDFSVPLSKTSGFLFDSKSGVRIPVGKNIVGTAEIEFDWDNEPPPGIREDDTTYGLKIGYEW